MITAIALFAGGCGYSLVGRGSALPPGIRSIHIPIFVNKTGEPDLDTIVTRAVKEGFIRDGRLKVLESSSADSALKGVIQTYGLRPLAYDADNNVTEYSVDITALITHTQRGVAKPLVRQVMQTKRRYQVDPLITEAERQRLAAIEAAAGNAAESIISIVIEAF